MVWLSQPVALNFTISAFMPPTASLDLEARAAGVVGLRQLLEVGQRQVGDALALVVVGVVVADVDVEASLRKRVDMASRPLARPHGRRVKGGGPRAARG